MQRQQRTPRHDSPLHSRWMSKCLRGASLLSRAAQDSPVCASTRRTFSPHGKGQEGSLVKFTSCLGLSRMLDGGRADVWIKGSHLVVLPGSGPTGAQQVPGNTLQSRGSPGKQKVHAFNLGNNGSLISQEETEVAGCCVDLRKERWPPLPCPILAAVCHRP